jgi:choice-of-anchor A domain-containing protein
VNLGYGYSKAIPEYEGCYPHIRPIGSPTESAVFGEDDGVAVFVGGNYLSKKAAEVEGKMVVMGDLTVKPNGSGNFVSAGEGTHVIPGAGTECIIIGGKIHAERDIQVFNQREWMTCDIVYKGGKKNLHKWFNAGAVRHEPDYDLTDYQKMQYYWRKKSQYWKTLDSTGEVLYEDWNQAEGQTTYQCGDDPVQIFNIEEWDNKKMKENVHSIYFSDSCEGKTILINVHGLNVKMDAAAMHFKGKKGYGEDEFDTCLTESILWNFPDAEWVTLGDPPNGKTSEWHGSVLVGGNMKMHTSGQSGRAIVLGDIIHEHEGSEFHSYQFNPPYPLPEPPDICEPLPENWLAVANGDERVPSYATEPEDCEPIAQVDLPEFDADGKRVWKTIPEKCQKCQNGHTGWPCDKTPSICWGKACVLTND